MIFLILQAVIAKHIGDLNTTLLYNKLEKSDPFEVVIGEQMRIRDYPEAKYVIDSKIEQKDTSNVCYTMQGKVKFGDYEDFSQKIFSLPDQTSNDPEYYLNIPVLLNMVHIKHAFAMVTSNHQLLIYAILPDDNAIVKHKIELKTNYSFQSLREGVKQIEIPQIIYADHNQYLYLIYRGQVIGGKVDYNNFETFTMRNITQYGLENDNKFIGNVKVYGWQIYVPMGTRGLDIYQYQENGDFEKIGTINALTLYDNNKKEINIVDVVFGGNSKQKYMYVLDYVHGITRFKIVANSTGVATQLDNELGLIFLQYGITFEEYNDQYLLILCQKDVIEYLIEIALFESSWFRVRVHFLTGHYSEIDILPEFALLRGKDEHRIIRTGIFELFESEFIFSRYDNFSIEKQNSYYEDYVFVPHLLAVDFYDVDKGNVDTGFNYNITNTFLIGITSQSVVYMPFIVENPYVVCHPYAKSHIGKTFDYTLKLNATHCPQKDSLMKKDSKIPSQLILCQYEDRFSVLVTNGDGTLYDTETLASIVMGFIVLLIMLSILLAYLYTKYKLKRDTISDEIQGFGENQNKTGYDLDPQYPQQDVSGL